MAEATRDRSLDPGAWSLDSARRKAMNGNALRGQVVLVTGGAGGIGRRIAQMFGECGASTVVADIREDDGRAVTEELRRAGVDAQYSGVDITNPSSVEAMVSDVLSHFGRVDILVNSAGLDSPLGRAWEEDEQHWQKIIDVDLNGAWWCAKAVIPHMIAKRSGRIIFISSVAAWKWSGTSVAYNAAKAGVIGLTYALASELEPHGILVNAIAPGPTGSTGREIPPEERERLLPALPLGFGGADPVAHACLYLAAESGRWVSGSVLNVSGGYWKG
jgi:NAD(P)-dependent dehydrogenase (short-subunit alcohol dehydrogenase family)